MSPAGIPVFYGADDFETACLETVDPRDVHDKTANGVQFENIVELNILDLTALPREYSFFLEWTRQFRHSLEFLDAFAHQLSLPIKSDGRQHIEYVPTQVFTEFIRYEMQTPSGQLYHGLKYRSSKNRHACYVLFLTQQDCLNSDSSRGSQVFQFVEGTLRTTPLES